MWNEGVGMFKKNRNKEIKISSTLYKFASREENQFLKDLSILDLEMSQDVYYL